MRTSKIVVLMVFIFVLLSPVVGHAASIRLDGDFTDWVDKPLYDPMDNDNDDINQFRQLKWHLSEDEDELYIMTSIFKPKKKGKITTVLETDFGTFKAVTDYNIEYVTVESDVYGIDEEIIAGKAVSVMTSVKTKKHKWEQGGDWGSIMDDGSVCIEYRIPINEMIEDMDWGYLIRFRLLNASADAPKNSWITISTASTFPYVGVGICVGLGILIPAIIAIRKKKL